EAEADGVKPALDAMTDSERGKRRGSERGDAACEHYVDEGEYNARHRRRQAHACDRSDRSAAHVSKADHAALVQNYDTQPECQSACYRRRDGCTFDPELWRGAEPEY